MPPAPTIHTARLFPLPRAALYAAFADPAMLARWWGPAGSTNDFEVFDLRPGGAWRFTMRAPDGAAYAMSNEFVEVRPPERVVVRHLQEGHGFVIDLRWEAVDDACTRLDWRMTFDDAAEAERVRAFVTEANEQNLDRLEAALGLPSSRPAAVGSPAELSEQLVPEVMVRDLDRSLALYLALGFTLDRRDGGFAALRWGERRLFLDESAGLPPHDGPSRANLRILVPDVDLLWDIARGLGLAVERPIADRPYGLRDFTVRDPDGFGLRFASPLPR